MRSWCHFTPNADGAADDDAVLVVVEVTAGAVDGSILDRHAAASSPLVVRGGWRDGAAAACAHFDALALGVARARTLRVACSATDRFSGTVDAEQHVAMRLGTFMDHARAFGTRDDPLAGSGAAFYLSQVSVTRRNGASAALPELAGAAAPPCWLPPAAAAAAEAHVWVNAGAPTTSDTHYDAEHNVLCIARGEKLVALAPPGAAARLRALPLHSVSAHHARVALLPAAGGAAPAAGTACVLLRAGDALFLPEGWWHSVLSAPHTLALNFWWPGLRAAAAVPRAAHFLARELLGVLAGARVERWRRRGAAEAWARLRAAAAAEGVGAAAGAETWVATPSASRRPFAALVAAAAAGAHGGAADGGDGGGGGADVDMPHTPGALLGAADPWALAAAVAAAGADGDQRAAALRAALFLLPSQAAFDALTAPLPRADGGVRGRSGGPAVSSATAEGAPLWAALRAADDLALDAVADRWERAPPVAAVPPSPAPPSAAATATSDPDAAAVATELVFADLWACVNGDTGGEGSGGGGGFPRRFAEARGRLQRRALAEVLRELCGEEEGTPETSP